jgi:hypothetical protein
MRTIRPERVDAWCRACRRTSAASVDAVASLIRRLAPLVWERLSKGLGGGSPAGPRHKTLAVLAHTTRVDAIGCSLACNELTVTKGLGPPSIQTL